MDLCCGKIINKYKNDECSFQNVLLLVAMPLSPNPECACACMGTLSLHLCNKQMLKVKMQKEMPTRIKRNDSIFSAIVLK